MGTTCSNPDFRGTFGVTTDEISINCVNSEIKSNKESRSLSVHMTYVGLPLHLKERRETLKPPSLVFVIAIPPHTVLTDLYINWGRLNILHQVPQVLPREIKTRIFAVYVLLTGDSPLKTDIIAGGFLNGRQVEEILTVNCCDNVGKTEVMLNNLEAMQNCMDNGGIFDDLHPFGVPSRNFQSRTDSLKTLFEYSVEPDTSLRPGPGLNSYFNRKRNSIDITKISKKDSISIWKENQLQRSHENVSTTKKSLVIQNWISGDLDTTVLDH